MKKLYTIGRAGDFSPCKVFAESEQEAISKRTTFKREIMRYESTGAMDFESTDGTWWTVRKVAA